MPNTRLRSLHTHTDLGETLIEILLTIVITGLTITALISSLANTGNAANVQRNNVRSDVVMRDYAEATKAAVHLCVAGGSYSVVYTPPVGFTVKATPTATLCPNASGPLLLRLDVAGPMGLRDTMQIKVLTP